MIDHLDNVLRTLLLTRVPGLTSESQVRFEPPDDNWRNVVATLTVNGDPANALNVYLVDLRENRELRANERMRTIEAGIATDEPAPTRVDCHYLVSAWSPAAVTPAVEPTLDEHALLAATLAALENAAPINPSRIYPPGSAALASVPELIRDSDLPTTVAPPDGFTKLPEFWGTMGVNHRAKPVIYLVVTIPVALDSLVAGPLVTTRIIEFRQTGKPETAEVWIHIGGRVLDPVENPVGGAWVALETLDGLRLQTTTTNALGRFTFDALRADAYRLRTRAAALGEQTRELEVPTDTGEYDLRF
jgi:hypothetical protein